MKNKQITKNEVLKSINLNSSLNVMQKKKEEIVKPENLKKVDLVVDSEWRSFVPDK